MLDDLQLLERWRGGDKSAGQQLAQRHYREIFERLRRGVGGDAEVAAELTQRVFEVAVTKLDEVSDFRLYLHGTARFKLWEHIRRRAGLPAELDPELSRLLDPSRGVESVLVHAEDSSLLVEALQTLSLEEQAYLMWYIGDGLTQPQIAARVGLTTSQVNGKIHRAKEKLRKRIEMLSESPEQRETVDKGFETWMRSLRRRVDDAGTEE